MGIDDWMEARLVDCPPLTAAEEMEGELPVGVVARNFGDTAGPAESQLYLDELESYNEA